MDCYISENERKIIERHDGPISIFTETSHNISLPSSKFVVNVVAYSPKRKGVLLVKSSKKGRSWELPGGSVEKNESPWKAATRELREESGYNVEGIEENGIVLLIGNERHVIRFNFIGKLGKKENKPDSEVEEIGFYEGPPETLSFPRIDSLSVRQAKERVF